MSSLKRVEVIYNSVDEASPVAPPDRRVADQDTVEMAKEIAQNLKGNYEVGLTEILFDHPEKARFIKTDIVFNLCEGVGYDFACRVIENLEKANLPYVGADALNYQIGSDKALLKELLNRYHLPTPQGQLFRSADEDINPRLKYPLIVKPEFEHGSVGITFESVVGNKGELREQLKRVFEVYGPGAVAEEYIDGRELQLTFVGNADNLVMFPVKEILFTNGMLNRWHIVTFAAKWEEESPDYKGTPTVCPAENLSVSEIEKLEALGREAFLKTTCQDYTRIDVRYNQSRQQPYILDVNPNPDLSSDAAVAKAAAAYGWNYQKLLTELVTRAWERSQKESTPRSSTVVRRLRRQLEDLSAPAAT